LSNLINKNLSVSDVEYYAIVNLENILINYNLNLSDNQWINKLIEYYYKSYIDYNNSWVELNKLQYSLNLIYCQIKRLKSTNLNILQKLNLNEDNILLISFLQNILSLDNSNSKHKCSSNKIKSIQDLMSILVGLERELFLSEQIYDFYVCLIKNKLFKSANLVYEKIKLDQKYCNFIKNIFGKKYIKYHQIRPDKLAKYLV
jgi:hypothetical protein